MRDVIRGVIKDHRIPGDYKFHFNQPFHTKAFLKPLRHFLAVRIITKPNVAYALYTIFLFSAPFFGLVTLWHYLYNGYKPQVL